MKSGRLYARYPGISPAFFLSNETITYLGQRFAVTWTVVTSSETPYSVGAIPIPRGSFPYGQPVEPDVPV